MTRSNKLALLCILLLLPTVALASVDAANSSYSTLAAATSKVADSLQSIGLKLFFMLTMLQFIITMYGQLTTDDVGAAIGKLARVALWTLFCLYLMSNNHAHDFIANTIQYFLDSAIGWASGTSAPFDAAGVLNTGINAMDDARRAIMQAAFNSTIAWFIPGGSIVMAVYGALLLGLVVLTIISTSCYVALKVFMVKIEAALILAVMPLSLSLLGMNALRDQGFAPFRSMLALIYRIIILGMVIGGMATAASAIATFAASEASPNILEVSLSLSFGFLLMGFIAFKSESIASSLAAGTANLGSSDATSATMAGAAAGAAVAAVTGGLAAAGTNMAKSMSDVMSGLSGGGSSVTNASTRGTGSTPEAAPSKSMASMGKSSNAFPSASSGAPRKPDSAGTGTTSSSGPSSPTTPGVTSGEAPKASPSPATSSSSSTAGSGASSDDKSAQPSNPGNEGNSTTTPGATVSGNPSESAGIGGAPQRDRDSSRDPGQQGDASSAPKKPSHVDKLKESLGKLSQHDAKEKQATHVSINTHPHD